MKRTLTALTLATTLALTACAGESDNPSANSSSLVPTAAAAPEDSVAACNVNPDGTFHMSEARVSIAASGARSMVWNYDQEIPQGSLVSFDSAGDGATMGVTIQDGEVVENYWFDMDNAQNFESDFPVTVVPGEVSVAMPPAIAPAFNDAWQADLSIDGVVDTTCKHF